MVDADKSSTTGRKLMQALQMHEFGVLMMRQNLKRKYPRDSPDETEKRLSSWLQGHDLMGVHPRDFSPTGRTTIE